MIRSARSRRMRRVLLAAALLCAGYNLGAQQVQGPQTAVAKVLQHQPLLLGSAWYPEQWPESQWEADLALMEAAHMNVVRIGEFAWSSLEPREGELKLDWMERAVALAARHHLAVVIGTPTDAPPAWLTTKYPETLGMNADGRWREHGGRRQFNYADPKYRELCRGIVTALGARFGHSAHVIGWQIGNEYTDESFDPATRKQFQKFLQDRYGALASLNQHWATAYWSQTYTDWAQIPLVATGGNPGLLLEHKHFVTATWRSFQKNQIDALRPLIAQSQFITTNIGGLAWSDNWDHYAVSADLDLASWDDYVGQGHLDVAKNAMLNDFVRGWRRQNFWVMETQPGSVNWAPVNNALDPGETRALAWQTVGHGADAVLYWQWRAALNGQEEYHGAIVGPDGQPLPLYAEVQKLGEDFAKTSAALAGTTPVSSVAILHTYNSRWAIDFQLHTKDYDQQQVLLRFYKPLAELAQAQGKAVDIIDPTQAGSLSQYKLLVAPSLNVINEALAAKLLAWVREGGTLLLGPRSGMKDDFDALHPQRQPGPLSVALGAHVSQFYALEQPAALEANDGSGSDVAADTWAETIAIDSPYARITLRYASAPGSWLSGKPAMVTRAVGKGTLAYLATLPDASTLLRILQPIAAMRQPTSRPFSVPEGVELCARYSSNGHDDGTRRTVVYILINHGRQTVHVSSPMKLDQLLGPRSDTSGHTTEVSLPSQEVAVFTGSEGVTP